MSRLGFKKSVVYHGDVRLGELDIIPVADQNFQFPNNEIRIHHISPQSERCPPLSILQTISSYSVRCKLESSSPVEQPHLINLHASCFHEVKTAVVVIGDQEIHLVPMPSKQKKFPCFWCIALPVGLYNSCSGLLNLRCLAIVFDLDETLIVANTMKSFEDRIEALRVWIARESDPVRIQGMSAEMKRYMDDRLLLKQYLENDSVMDNGKSYQAQLEEVQRLSDAHETVMRPVIRLQDRNIVLTRINPKIRDTSVLVRLRPAWEDLRSYLTAKGRKRFEVYVCTMAERDYALEMWRLLDPEAHLIASNQLLDRVVCVKSGLRKSLLNVFQNGICHPKMAMVIDDRSKVWEDKDQPHVHVVPPFTPYYAPQAETANAVPVLCVARNVACNVRGCFFREFDDNLIRRISEVFYEDEVTNLPSAPDVSNYMMSEDVGFTSNGNNGVPFNEGMSGAEVERQLSQPDEKTLVDPTTYSMTNNPVSRSDKSHIMTIPSVLGPMSSTSIPSQKPSLLGAPVKKDSRRNSDQPPILSRVTAPIPSYFKEPQGGWLVEEDISGEHINNRPSGFVQESGSIKSDKLRGFQNPSSHCTRPHTPSVIVSHAPQMKGEEASCEHDGQKQGLPAASQQSGTSNQLPSNVSMGVLQEIARRCGSKVEYRSVEKTGKNGQVSVEVLFTGEKIAVGVGNTRKDAQQQAAKNALHGLAEKYVAFVSLHSGAVDQDLDKLSLGHDNGFLWEIVSPGSSEAVGEEDLPRERTPEAGDTEFGNTSSTLANQLMRKHANSPRLQPSLSNKTIKGRAKKRTKAWPPKSRVLPATRDWNHV